MHMFQLSGSLTNLPVISLRTGGRVAVALRPIINPNNLKVEGWYCQDHFSKDTLVLLAKDVRDIVPQGIAVDDHEKLSTPDELIRLKDVLKIDFKLIGKHVVTNNKRRVGKVDDYATDNISFMIHKLYVAQPVYKSITGGQLTIDRSQIVEIDDKQIVIKEAFSKSSSPIPVGLVAS